MRSKWGIDRLESCVPGVLSRLWMAEPCLVLCNISPNGVLMSDLSLRSSPLLGIAGAVLCASGLFTFATGAQCVAAFSGPLFLLLGLFVVALGILEAVCGGLIIKPRLGGIAAATALTAFAVIFLFAFNVFLVSVGVFSPLALIAGLISVPALVLVGASIPAHVRGSRVRRALYA